MSILSTPATATRSIQPHRSLWTRWSPSLRYLLSTEVHVYAFAIAANVLLSFVPFCVMLLVVSRKILDSTAASNAVLAMLQDSLPYFDPARPDFISRNIQATASTQKA